MAPQVTIVVNAPEAVEVNISIPEATKDKPKPQEPIDMDKEPVTTGKLNGKSFKDALKDREYVKWILNNRQRLKHPNLVRLASYVAAKQ